MSRLLNDIRRCVLAVCIFGLILSLIGSELPWIHITQSTPQSPIYITDQPTCNKTALPDHNDGEYPIVHKLSFNLKVLLTLTAADVCQSYTSGSLPSYIGGADLKDVEMCAHIAFKHVSNFMSDAKEWDTYAKQCHSAGGGTFFLIVAALIILAVTMIVNTFPKLTQKCCAEQNSFRNRVLRSLFALLAPALVTLALVIYSTKCKNGDLSRVLATRKMSRSGGGGYTVACITCVLLWLYSALFLYRVCSKQETDAPAGDVKARFLRNDGMDADMLDETQEQRETLEQGAGGGYDHASSNNNDAYNNNAYNNGHEEDPQRHHKISAYDDDGIQGPMASAGSWKDVEE